MKNVFLAVALLLPMLAGAHSGPRPPEPLPLDELATAFGWDFNTEIETQKIADGFYVLFGIGGNIAVSVGDDGVLIVDDQFPRMMKKIRKAIKKIGGGDVDFAVTTHWHFDHAEGNLELGPAGTWLVAQENSREMMKEDHLINLVTLSYMQKAYPESAWPDITYGDEMSFHLNGQTVDLMHFGPAHTTGDSAVIFRGVNAVHLGDVYNNSGYPFIDAGNGGSLDGVIHFCSETLKEIDEDTVVIPGHGPVSDYAGLKAYIDMLTDVRERMVEMINEGKSLQEVIDANLTAEYDAKQGDSTTFVNRAYMSLTHKRGIR